MFGLAVADIVVIVLYFAVMIGIGFWSSRRIQTQEDYFLAGRRFGKLVQTFAAFGQATSADNAVGVTTTTFNNGIAGIWSSLLYLFATPLYWLVTHWPRRMRVMTLGDYFRDRYHSTAMGAVYSLIGSVGMMAFIALGFSAMSKTIVAITPKDAAVYSLQEQADYRRAYQAAVQLSHETGESLAVLSYDELVERERLEALPAGQRSAADQARLEELQDRRPAASFSHVSKETLIWVVCLIVMLYAVLGGLEAAFLTDMIQGMFIILLSVLLIPFAWAKINHLFGGHGPLGAFGVLHEQLPRHYFQVFGAPQTPDFTWYYVLTLSFMAALTVVVQPNGAVLAGSAKDELSNRTGVVVGNFLKRFCTVFWAVFGLGAIVLYQGKVIHSDLVWGYATRDLLGPLNLGLVGLMIACLMAALMSTVDCYMITCASLLTHNFYEPLVPNRSQRHYVWAGRVFGTAVVLGGAWVALQFDTILQILKFIWEINVMLAPAYWLGIKWRRANRLGAWASIGLGAALFLVVPVVGPLVVPSMRTQPSLLATTQPADRTLRQVATAYDVRERHQAIERWQRLAQEQRAEGPCPEPLQIGEPFERTYRFARRSIYWTQGLKVDEQGRLYGSGRFNIELWLLDRLGVDLQNNPYALNETLRILIRTLLPFAIMIAVSLMTPRDPADVLRGFYTKMRTVVRVDPQADAEAVRRALEHPESTEALLLWPRSEFEFYRWSRQDIVGFVWSLIGVAGVLGFVGLLVRIGM